MRILHVTEPIVAGVPSLVTEIVEQQSRRGDTALLLAPHGFPPPRLTELREWSLVRSRLATYPGAIGQLRATVRDFRPDVVHLHSFMAGFLGRLPAVVAPVPIVYQPHAWSFDLKKQAWFGGSVKAWERLAGRRTGMLVTNCQDEIDEGRAVGVVTEAMSVGVAIDLDRFAIRDDAERERQREACGVREPRMLVCAGRIVRQKGHDQLVREWEHHRPAGTELVLVGPGDTAPLEALAPTQWGRSIRAVGQQADIRPWLWASDALVLPSRYETVAMVAAEALSCGRPVVATDVNGAREVVEGGALASAGRIVALGDMRALIDEVSALLDDPGVLADMGPSARARAEYYFRPAAVADRLQVAYERAAATVTRRGR